MAHLVKKQSVCIFVSSTFVDMEVERDIINNEILNQLRDDFAEKNVEIYFVDLRWGINTIDVDNKNKRNEKILKVCMSEIDRCHPYFIGLLGKRYGWTPDDALLYSCFLKEDIDNCRQFFSIDKPSVTALETYHALVQKNLNLNRCFLFQRKDSVYSSIPPGIRSDYIDPEHKQDLELFQNRIISYFVEKENKSHFVSYGGDWKEKRFVPDESFYNSLYKVLYEAIQQDIKTELSFNNEIEKENYYQDIFLERTSYNTIARPKIIEEIEYLLQEEKGIVLHAPSGHGKSTFLCQLYHQLINSNQFEVLFYSAVASSNSSSMLNLIESLAYRMAHLIGVDYEIIEKNYNNQFSASEFSDYTSLLGKGGYSESYIKEEMSYEQLILGRLLDYISTYKNNNRKPLLLLIDAYDRFEFSSLLHSLQWLKSLNVRFVITTLTDIAQTSSTFASIQKKELPSFTIEETLKYIRKNRNGKELHETVVNAIVERKKDNEFHAYASPLWLKLIVHVFTSLDITDFQNIELLPEDDKEKRIHNYMRNLVYQVPCSPGDALLFFIDKAETYIGRDFSIEVLKLLAFSGSGLREKDLEKLMGERWSGLDFAVLHRWIRPYLIIGTEKQWLLAHQLFVNTIKDKYKEEECAIYNRLLQLCMELPEDDVIRVKMGMQYAILAHNEYMDAVHYYTFNCRLPENIQQATNILIDYLRTYPDYLNELTLMTEKWHKDYYDRFTAERILFTLGNQLYKQGLFQQAKQLYLFYEPVLERNTEGLYVSEFFLPMIYDRLAFIYDNEYNKEMSSHYKQKSQHLIEDLDSQNSEDDDNDSLQEDIAMEYAIIINDLYERSEDQNHPYIEELFDAKFQNNEWTKSWLDEFLHVLGDIYASISCPSYHPQHEFWKQELPNALKRYDTIIPYNESNWKIEINPFEHSFFFKYNAMLTFMEFLLRQLVHDYRDMALRMQHDCLCLYSSIASSQQNEDYFDECALGYNLAGSFYLENGEIEKAINANLLAVHYCSHAQNIFPNSIRIRKRYLFANHSLGRCLFSICKYEEALKPLVIYHDGIKEILENDATQLTMVSSYLNALDIIGRCHMFLHNYNDALVNFDTMQTVIRAHLNDAPQPIYFSWLTMLFNCKYFIARCYIECGQDEIGYQWANGLYNELLNNGIPHDSDYEPMENVRELLGME